MRSAASAALLLASLLLTLSAANLMAVDLGEAYIKVSVARPGRGLELVPNEQSKRKTPAVVGFTQDGERLFGDAAVAFAAKSPARVIFNARRLIGACAEGETDPYPKCKPATVTVEGVGTFSGVHAVAMLLAMARRQAKAALDGGKVSDVAVTVPSWFEATHRADVCNAAAVAGLNCLGVVNANTAAAVKYALDGKVVNAADAKASKDNKKKKGGKPAPHTVLFVDAGASGISATVARFARDSASSTVSKIDIVAHASDTTVGGAALDEVVVSRMADAFDKQRAGTAAHKEDPRAARELPRVMARLRKEARRVREILSANTERLVAIGSLHQDRDFKTVVTRQELVDGSKHLLPAVTRPVLAVLDKAGVSPADLDAVVPFGGASRMPAIQELVLKALGRDVMNKSINSDEAAVIGAAFFGAGASSTFRVRKLDVNERFKRTVSAEVQRDLESAGRLSLSSKKTRKAAQKVVVFDAEKGTMPAKKTLSFSREDDCEVKVFFEMDKKGESTFPGRTVYAHMKLTGVKKVLEKVGKNPGSKKGATGKQTPRVALTFRLDRSGNVFVSTAEASVDETITVEREVVIKEKKEKKTKVEAPKDDAKKDEKEDGKDDAPKEDAKKDEKKGEKKKAEKPKTRIEKREQSIIHRHTLSVEYLDAPESIRSLTMMGKPLDEAKKVLKALEDADNERAERADALNGLEGYILGARSKIRGAEEGDEVFEVSTEEERTKILEKLDEAEDWMFGDEAGKTINLRKKHHELRDLMAGIDGRIEGRRERPKAVKQLRDALEEATPKVAELAKLHTERGSKHAGEFDGFAKLAEDTVKWLDDEVAKQEKVPATEEAVLTVGMIEDKFAEVGKEIKKLAALELPPAPKEEKKDETKDEKKEGEKEVKVEVDGKEVKVNKTEDEKKTEGIPDPDPAAAKTGANVETPAKDEL